MATFVIIVAVVINWVCTGYVVFAAISERRALDTLKAKIAAMRAEREAAQDNL